MNRSYMPPWHERLTSAIESLLCAMFPPKRTLPTDAVVLVLDAIEPYRSLWTSQNDRRLKALLAFARAAGRPVVFTQWERTREWPRDVIAEKGHWSEFVKDREAAILPGLVKDEDRVVKVVHANAFTNETVGEVIGSHTLVIAGMWTEACVSCTARAAAERNVRVYVAADCCSGHMFAHQFALWTMQALYATVIRTQ